ncbi:hypothetical protein JYU34_014036 [Plutella xylostella]|uniref:Uncharacterized protein n=1 Tax=Plutella xylostella TaxID=51655 RepID=A0ABQ7Q8H8_PLUXY|nr:uncharacterized protein LOC105383361 [Plutella xylostella]KAG7301188.1 hypothetical protein JYU34_014036 [Plutella xylostella]
MVEDEVTLEEKCENLMNIVVESRKRFGKMCVDYHQKTSLIENKILNLNIETISNYHFKPKNPVPNVDIEDNSKEIEDFTAEIMEKQRRIDNLRKKLKCTEEVVAQLKRDDVNKRVKEPLSVQVMLERAKKK